MKKIFLLMVFFGGLIMFCGNDKALAQTVQAGVQTTNYSYLATATVTSDATQTKRMMTPYYHTKKTTNANKVDETIGLTQSKSVGFSVSGNVQLGVDSGELGLKLLAASGCSNTVSTTISKSYTKTIYRGDKTGYYWLEAVCPTSKLKVTAEKYKRNSRLPAKLITSKSVTLRFAPKLNKLSYRFTYAKTL